MERLSKLLNEYLESKKKDIKQFMNIAALMTQSDSKLYQTYIISKDFDFIKRLVENDKIDREKLWNSETKSSKYSDFELSYDTPREDYTNILLMELAIRDNPLTFILDILK